ncbi:putative 2-hydroxyacid dehydrogenase YPL113C [Trichomonascus vanleenenianus]|uniref:putative 2-hydroxyacid dehydrogenase YPL113C n=1 Tax=Trichomonascus vanleenenianus TaxID=2268995 RepID=UPI003EC9AB33
MVEYPKMRKVLVIEEVETDYPEYDKFAKDYELIRYKLTTKEQFIADIKGKYSDIEAIWALWLGFMPIGGLKDDDVIEALPASMKVLAIASVGYDQYGVEKLKARGITVTNSPGFPNVAVAEIAVHLALSAFRFTTVFETALRECRNTIAARKVVAEFDKQIGSLETGKVSTLFQLGQKVGINSALSLRGHTAGIAGFGQIGKEIGRLLSAFGMNIHYLKRSPLTADEQAALGYHAVHHASFESLARASELLVLALPLTPATEYILNEKTIAALPDGAKIVNIGRGKLIDQKALVNALKNNKISSAGLDVFEQEPLIESELANRQDVTLLPHLGCASLDAYMNGQANAIKNIRAVLETSKPIHPV